MKCFYHHDKDAHAICKNCGKAICSDCSITRKDEAYWPDCFSNLIAYHEKNLSKMRMIYIVGIITAAVVFFMNVEKSFEGALLMAMWFGSIPIGLYCAFRARSPYVAITLEGFGQLLLIRLVVALLFGPIYTLLSVINYLKAAAILRKNKALLEEIISR